jgi:hypothetical protein
MFTVRLEKGEEEVSAPTAAQFSRDRFMNRLRNGCAVQNRHLKISATTAVLTGIKLVATISFKTSLNVHFLNYQHTLPYAKYSKAKYGLYTMLRGPPPETAETRAEKTEQERI